MNKSGPPATVESIKEKQRRPSSRSFYLDHVFLRPIHARHKIETKPEKEITNALVTAQEKSSTIATILPDQILSVRLAVHQLLQMSVIDGIFQGLLIQGRRQSTSNRGQVTTSRVFGETSGRNSSFFLLFEEPHDLIHTVFLRRLCLLLSGGRLLLLAGKLT
jgi:hypothetical protein